MYMICCCCSITKLCLTFVILWTAACQAFLSFTISRSLLKLMFTKSVMPPYHLTLCHPLLLLPQSFPASGFYFNESALPIRWPKFGTSASSSVLPMNIHHQSEYSKFISFGMDWLDLLAVQGTLKSLLQHHSSKASVLRHSAFFTVQLSHPYMTTGKTIALTRK